MLMITIIVLLFLGLLLLVSNIDINIISREINRIKQRANKEKNRVYYNKRFVNLLDFIERLIQRSNIRVYIPYSIGLHFFVCFIFFILGAMWLNQYMSLIVSIIFGLGLCTIPFLLLKIITDILSYRIKRTSVDFLIILKNFFISGRNTDIFESFKKASEFIAEPLKTYINIMIYEYEHKINPIQCLENFKDNIEVAELKIFVENLKICYIHGGDILGLIDAFIEEISQQNDDEDEESTEDSMLNMGLYMLLLINFIVMYFLINSSYRHSILEPVWGQVVFVLDILISIYIVIQSMSKLQDERR